jgi:hypothetical protein
MGIWEVVQKVADGGWDKGGKEVIKKVKKINKIFFGVNYRQPYTVYRQ